MGTGWGQQNTNKTNKIIIIIITGGNALRFYASVRLEVRKSTPLKDSDEVVGYTTVCKVVKNKVAPPLREATFDMVRTMLFVSTTPVCSFCGCCLRHCCRHRRRCCCCCCCCCCFWRLLLLRRLLLCWRCNSTRLLRSPSRTVHHATGVV